MQLAGDVDPLRAVGRALVAADAVVGLPQAGYAAVVAYEVGAPGLAVVLVLHVVGDIALVEALVVVTGDKTKCIKEEQLQKDR